MKYFVNGKAQKFQMGGAAPAEQGGGQEEMIQQIAQMIQQQGPEAALQALVQSGMDQQQAQGIIQQIMQMMQGQAQAAKNGAKLSYIKRLRGNCPEGYEMGFFKAGGKVCSKCMKKKATKDSMGNKLNCK